MIDDSDDMPEGWPIPTPGQIRDMLLGVYHMDNPEMDATTFDGPELLTDWYERNVRTVHNLWKAVDEDTERVVLPIGSGHVRVLRHLLDEAPMFCPVSPLSLLPEPTGRN